MPKHLGWALAALFILAVPSSGQTGSGQTPPPPPPKQHRHKIDESDTAAPRGEKGTALAGTVVTAKNKPVAGATVILTSRDDATQRWTAKTDNAGRFKFEVVLLPGAYQVAAEYQQQISSPMKVSVPVSKAIALRLHAK